MTPTTEKTQTLAWHVCRGLSGLTLLADASHAWRPAGGRSDSRSANFRQLERVLPVPAPFAQRWRRLRPCAAPRRPRAPSHRCASGRQRQPNPTRAQAIPAASAGRARWAAVTFAASLSLAVGHPAGFAQRCARTAKIERTSRRRSQVRGWRCRLRRRSRHQSLLGHPAGWRYRRTTRSGVTGEDGAEPA